MKRAKCSRFRIWLLVALNLLGALNIGLAREVEIKTEVILEPGFIEASKLLKNPSDLKHLSEKVFVGRIEEGQTRQIPLNKIHHQFSKNGLFSLIPIQKNGPGYISVTAQKGIEQKASTQKLDNANSFSLQPDPNSEKSSENSPYRYLVFKERITRGHIVQNSDVEWKDSKIPIRGGVEDLKSVIGHQARSSYKKGAFLLKKHFYLPPLIFKNQAVKIASISPSLTITAIGKALEEGYLGDIIEVRRRGGVVMRARIVASDTVHPIKGTQ